MVILVNVQCIHPLMVKKKKIDLLVKMSLSLILGRKESNNVMTGESNNVMTGESAVMGGGVQSY